MDFTDDISIMQKKKQELSSSETGDYLATIDMGRKVLGAAVPFRVGGAVSPSNTMCFGARPTSVPSDILIHPTIWLQCTNVTDRQTVQTIVR